MNDERRCLAWLGTQPKGTGPYESPDLMPREAELRPMVLVVEDERAIREMVVDALQRAGFETHEAEHAADAQAFLDAGLPDLILLDWMLPGTSGLEFARRLRRTGQTRDLPIIMLTARTEEEEKVRGFDVGVDDYVGKPFSVRELVARIQAVLRRATPADEERVIEVAGITLDPATHRVTADGDGLSLGPTEFRLLKFFMTHLERVFSRSQLLDQVWGSGAVVEERTVDVHIRRLRKTLEPSGYDTLIQTVHGAGYRFSVH